MLAQPLSLQRMIEYIGKYISIQKALIEELKNRSVDLWSCNETDVYGWKCNSHGEHICCIETNTNAQIELPLLAENCVGIDAGHFLYYLKSIGVGAPSYQEMHDMLEGYEKQGMLAQVQNNERPIIWERLDEI